MTRVDPSHPAYQHTENVVAGRPQSAAHPADEEPVNSDDELDQQPINAAEHVELERRFEERLRARGLHVRRMAEDGNCLFRAVSDRVYGDADMQDVVRRLCLDHMEKERDHFSPYVTEDFDAYIRRKRRDRVFGNHLEIQAISEIYNRPVHVFDVRSDADEPMNTFNAPSEGATGAPLRLSYHGRSHYNVVVDPSVADVGDGLGLPGYQPGLADRMQVEQAQQASEASAIESELLLSVRDASDVDATQEALLQAALAASAAEARGGLHTWGTGSAAHAAAHATSHAAADASTDASGASWGGESSEAAWASSCGTTGADANGGAAPNPFEIGDLAKPPPSCTPCCMPTSEGWPAGTAASAAMVSESATDGHRAGANLGVAAAKEASGSSDELVLSQEVTTLVAMGFSLPRAVQAHAQFGDDLDSMLEYLTRD